MKTRGLWILCLLAWLPVLLSPALAVAPAFKLIGPETLKGMLGDPKVMIIDVRTPSAYVGSDQMIKGAVRQDPGKVPTWAQTLAKDQKMVLYCSWPHEHTSARVAQRLVEMGFTQVMVLKGGWNAWLQGGYPLAPRK